MEKKVYRIKKWDYKNVPDCLEVLPRYCSEHEYHAEIAFIGYANSLLRQGCVIVHVTHPWSYDFRSKNGARFTLYMYED